MIPAGCDAFRLRHEVWLHVQLIVVIIAAGIDCHYCRTVGLPHDENSLLPRGEFLLLLLLFSMRSQTLELPHDENCCYYFVMKLLFLSFFRSASPKWETADAEIKDSSVENPEVKGFSFKAWSRLVYSRAYYAYCQEFLPFTISTL